MQTLPQAAESRFREFLLTCTLSILESPPSLARGPCIPAKNLEDKQIALLSIFA
jgi:hypothetical protein